MQTANDIIIMAIDLLVYAATGEEPGLAETWIASNHDTTRLEEAIEIIEADQYPTTKEDRALFNAAAKAIDGLTE